jgi:hypothetical protein
MAERGTTQASSLSPEQRGVHAFSVADLAVPNGDVAFTEGRLQLPSADPLSEPLRRVVAIDDDFLSEATAKTVGATGEVRINARDKDYSEIKKLLLASICAHYEELSPEQFRVELALVELIDNAVDNQKALDTDPSITLKWDLTCDSPYLVLGNRGSPLFDPTINLNRSVEDIHAHGEIVGSTNMHGATNVLASWAKHLSYFWCNDHDDREVKATLKCADRDADTPEYFLVSTARNNMGAIDDFNLAQVVATKVVQQFDRFAIGMLL